jgi:hypothetical protein
MVTIESPAHIVSRQVHQNGKIITIWIAMVVFGFLFSITLKLFQVDMIS